MNGLLPPEEQDGESCDVAADLKTLQDAIDEYCDTCAKGEWTPGLEEQLWRQVLGSEAPPFPFQSVPPERDLRVRCAEHQVDHREQRIPLPVSPHAAGDDRSKAEFLKSVVRWVTQQRGHDLCWEHGHMLTAALNLTRGIPEEPGASRPPLQECMLRCNLFATRLYGVVAESTKNVPN